MMCRPYILIRKAIYAETAPNYYKWYLPPGLCSGTGDDADSAENIVACAPREP